MLWAEHYRQSPQFQNYVAARQQQLMLGAYGAVSSGDRRPPRGHDSGLRQIPILARRQIDLIRNDKRTLFILLPVSYTHLDVYKRQSLARAASRSRALDQ